MKKILLVAYYTLPQKNACSDRASYIKSVLSDTFSITTLTVSNFGQARNEKNVIRVAAIYKWYLNPKKILYKLKTKIVEYFFDNVDYYWIQKALKYFKKKNRFDYDYVYAVYPSISSLKLGFVLSKKYKVDLITDFTDSLTLEPLRPQSGLQRKKIESFEKAVVESSLQILSVSRVLADYLKNKYSLNNIHTVYNGYDPDIVTTPNRSSDSKVRIAHFGNIGSSRSRDVNCLAIAMAVYFLENRHSNLEVHFFGNFSDEEMNTISPSKNSKIIFNNYVNKSDGYRILSRDFDYLLLYGVPGNRSTVTSKLIEYLGLQIPIVGICKGNEAEQIVKESGCGEVVGFDAQEIKDILVSAESKNIYFNPDYDYILSFTWNNQLNKIKRIF